MNTRELIVRRLFVKRITEDNDSFVAALQYVSNKTKTDIPWKEASELFNQIKK
jgi:hypothetical protein